MKTILFSIPAMVLTTAFFIFLNNIPRLPWEITKYLWCAYLPCTAAALAFAYGLSARRSGGSILLAAAVIVPIVILGAKYTLPFASAFQNIPSLIAAALLPLPAEIAARNLRRKRKKRNPKDPAPQI